MKADAKAEAAPAGGGSKKKLVIIIVATVLLLAIAGGAGAWFMLKGGADHAEEASPPKKSKKAKPVGPPVYVPVEPFTVNLQPEDGDQYLQVAFTLEVGTLEEVELIKTNMPKVRSRILLLLSSKRKSEINTPEGQKQLSQEILEQIKAPFSGQGEPQDVTEVHFTSFIIQ